MRCERRSVIVVLPAGSRLSTRKSEATMRIVGMDSLGSGRGDRRHPPLCHRAQLVAYLGLNPTVRQSGEGPTYHGRITKQGRGYAPGMVEAAWAAARSVGPLRAFLLRVSGRRGQHVAAVATARKLATIAWHMLRRGEDYVWVRPALHARKLRELELRSGSPSRCGQKGTAYEHATEPPHLTH
jgi:Transposase IS116/IS110/IS902 family